MASNAVTSSAALDGLKTKLTHLSEILHDIYDLMNEDLSSLAEHWKDVKYQEFVEGYKPQIEKCEKISGRYKDWCTKVLDPTIERVIAVEETNVSGEDVASGAVVAGAVGTGAAVAGIAGVGASNNPTEKKDTATPSSKGEHEHSFLRPVEEMSMEEILDELTPEQKEIYLRQKKELTDTIDKYNYQVFRNDARQDIIKEMGRDNARGAAAGIAGVDLFRDLVLHEDVYPDEREYKAAQEWSQKLDRAAREAVRNNRANGITPLQMNNGSGRVLHDGVMDGRNSPLSDNSFIVLEPILHKSDGKTPHIGQTSGSNVSDDVRGGAAINAEDRGSASSLSDNSSTTLEPQLRRSSSTTSHFGGALDGGPSGGSTESVVASVDNSPVQQRASRYTPPINKNPKNLVITAQPTQADVACRKKFGPGYHGEPSTQQEANVRLGDNDSSTGGSWSVTGGLFGGVKDVLGGNVSGTYSSGNKTHNEFSEGWAKCVPDQDDSE